MTSTYTDVTEGDKGKIFKDPQPLNVTPQKDPAVEFILNYWKPLLIAAAIAGAVWYAKMSFETSRRLSLEGASESFDTFREDIETYSGIAGELAKADISQDKRADLEKREKQLKAKIEEEARALNSVKDPYKTVAAIYEAGFLAVRGENEKAKGILSAIVNNKGSNNSWKIAADAKLVDNSDRIFIEGAAYKLANLLVDLKDPQGTSLLKEIADNGKLFAVAAGITLANLADTPEKKADAVVVLQSLQAKFPEEGKSIEPEINRLK